MVKLLMITDFGAITCTSKDNLDEYLDEMLTTYCNFDTETAVFEFVPEGPLPAGVYKAKFLLPVKQVKMLQRLEVSELTLEKELPISKIIQ